MTRTSSILSPVLAVLAALVAVGPASAADGYRSADAVLAGDGSTDGYRSADAVLAGDRPTGATVASDYRSADAVMVDDTRTNATVASDYRSADAVMVGDTRTSATVASDYRSADAVSAASGSPQAAPSNASSGGYVDALLRGPATSQPPTVPLVAARGGDSFDWDDALIGALMTSVLVLLMLAAARSVARHRRASAESRA